MFFKNIDVSWSEAAGGDIPLKNIDVSQSETAGGDIPLKNIDVSWSGGAGGDIPLNLIKKGIFIFPYLAHSAKKDLVKSEFPDLHKLPTIVSHCVEKTFNPVLTQKNWLFIQ